MITVLIVIVNKDTYVAFSADVRKFSSCFCRVQTRCLCSLEQLENILTS